jgi:hypothetical protein
MAAGFLRPVDDFCIDCNRQVDVWGERNYIVYDWITKSANGNVPNATMAKSKFAEQLPYIGITIRCR